MTITKWLFSLVCVTTIGMAPSQSAWGDAAGAKPNFLFIIMDDLRPELGCYGAKQVKTPNLDQLATEGTIFLNSYCNAAVCGASRASFMTGIRPTSGKRFRAWNARADRDAPGIPTLPEYLKKNGYHTVSNGKVMHVQDDSPQAWSEAAWRSNGNREAGLHIYNVYDEWMDPASATLVDNKKGPFYEAADVPDNAYDDGQLCDKTIADLKRLAEMKQPFFLACGFWRPHLPFNAPKKYWDLYDRDKIDLADNRFRPMNAPEMLSGSGELKDQYSATNGFPDDENFHRLARHGYYASVSYIDAQVGKILKSLSELGLCENTIVIVLGDNGFHLGEHNFWGKHNTMDYSVRVPMIIRNPKYKTQRLEQLVEFVDIYPTLCDFASLPTPTHCEGKSVSPIMENPAEIHKAAIYTSYSPAYSVKTQNFLYTEWKKNGPRMLFDHQRDPQENTNVAEAAEYKEEVERHRKLLDEVRTTWGVK